MNKDIPNEDVPTWLVIFMVFYDIFIVLFMIGFAVCVIDDYLANGV